MSDWLLPLARIWHRTFGEVKCHLRSCPVCGDTDWPYASWVSPAAPRTVADFDGERFYDGAGEVIE